MENNELENIEPWLTPRKIIALVVATVICVISAYVWKFHEMQWSDSTAVWGSFGDYFAGILSGILTPVTVVLIWFTYNSQNEESKQQRKIIVKQMGLLSQQSFEQTFFSWLHAIQNIRPPDQAEHVFAGYLNSISLEIDNYLRYCLINSEDPNHEGVKKSFAAQINSSYGDTYNRIVQSEQGWLDTYSYALIEFLKFIHENKAYPGTSEQKQQYVSILISHLNDGDRVLLGAFAIAKKDSFTFDLLKKYSFFSRKTGQVSIDRLLDRFNQLDL